MPAYSNMQFGQTRVSVGRFVQDVRKGNVDSFMERMQTIISGIPYGTFSEERLKLRERNDQTAIYPVFALIGPFVQTGVHCSTRRVDYVVMTTLPYSPLQAI